MSAYTDSVAANLAGLSHVSTGACPGCEECFAANSYRYEGILHPCDKCDGDTCDKETGADERARAQFAEDCHTMNMVEGEDFSRGYCDACGTSLAGSRHFAHAFSGVQLLHLSICSDCLFYLNYGDEPEEWEGE